MRVPFKTLIAAVVSAAAVFLVSAPACAGESVTRNIEVTVFLEKDGSALIREVWDMSVHNGTEQYLVRDNLGDIRISGLRVSDETSLEFVNESSWDVDRSLGAKAGRCGIITKGDGCEICWGLGSYGDHVYTVEYRMSNVVKSMEDYDCLHMQFVSPGISPRPQHVGVRILYEGMSLDDTNSLIWAFGYDGRVDFENGGIYAQTISPFSSDRNSVILLIRFDKALFSPQSSFEGSFEDRKEEAFRGSDYDGFRKSQQKEDFLAAFFSLLVCVLVICGLIAAIRRRNVRIFGIGKLSEIGYDRDLPFDGNLFETRYVLGKIGRIESEGNMAAALILKMVKDRILTVAEDSRARIEIHFNGDTPVQDLNRSERQFYGFLKEAAGSDGILQDREFSRWARKNTGRVTDWVTNLQEQGGDDLRSHGYLSGKSFSQEGQMHARRAVGFRKFLKDFTLIDERKSVEVALWQEYLIYASLFGCADKVAKELRDINPQAFRTYVGYDYPTMHSVIRFSRNMGTGVSGAVTRQNSSSVGGHGGFSSFGGGGGFRGGGFGGGVR